MRIARAAQEEARRRLDEVLTQVRSVAQGQATAGGATTGGSAGGAAANNLQRFAERVADTAAEAEAAAARSRTALVRLEMRLQRAGVVAGMLASGDLPAVADVLTGRWQVEVGPDGTGGIFELNQDGTLVEGSFRLDDGRRGSLRGTLIGRSLRLEQVDDQRGFSAIYEAQLDPAAGTLRGFWRPTDVSGGAPGGGDWTASRTTGGSS